MLKLRVPNRCSMAERWTYRPARTYSNFCEAVDAMSSYGVKKVFAPAFLYHGAIESCPREGLEFAGNERFFIIDTRLVCMLPSGLCFTLVKASENSELHEAQLATVRAM